MPQERICKMVFSLILRLANSQRCSYNQRYSETGRNAMIEIVIFQAA